MLMDTKPSNIGEALGITNSKKGMHFPQQPWKHAEFNATGSTDDSSGSPPSPGSRAHLTQLENATLESLGNAPQLYNNERTAGLRDGVLVNGFTPPGLSGSTTLAVDSLGPGGTPRIIPIGMVSAFIADFGQSLLAPVYSQTDPARVIATFFNELISRYDCGSSTLFIPLNVMLPIDLKSVEESPAGVKQNLTDIFSAFAHCSPHLG
jgi:hypothetical protein